MKSLQTKIREKLLCNKISRKIWLVTIQSVQTKILEKLLCNKISRKNMAGYNTGSS